MHREPEGARTRAHAVDVPRDTDAGSAVPLIAGLVGYVALLPFVAFGLCALAIFT
ncbi:MAG: hypothetical protein DHS20C14_21440 [Phycisphaeraceae bacterium]|nr:MAG: hypothetical protein DHS20C14_21440 [Phycisphaeraceae bacterium]